MSFIVKSKNFEVGRLEWEPPTDVQERLASLPHEQQVAFRKMFESSLRHLTFIMNGAAFMSPTFAQKSMGFVRDHLRMVGVLQIDDRIDSSS